MLTKGDIRLTLARGQLPRYLGPRDCGATSWPLYLLRAAPRANCAGKAPPLIGMESDNFCLDQKKASP